MLFAPTPPDDSGAVGLLDYLCAWMDDDDLLDETDLLARIAADPSPHADVVLVLAAAQRTGAPWPIAWARAMRAIQPPRDRSADADAVLDEDRVLLRELTPAFRAAYERRARTLDERKREDRLVRRRAPELGRAAY